MMKASVVSILLLFVSQTNGARRHDKACFVPAASPRLASPATATGYGLYSPNYTALWAKKAAPKKIQVKLLKHIAGTGQAGDVIDVTPAFFANKLRPTKSAEIISDEAVAKERATAMAEKDATMSAATALQDELEDYQLIIKRKAGPDGQLFGGVSNKLIMQELATAKPQDIWKQKSVKVTSVADEDGKKVRGDIKHTGTFEVTLSLTRDVKGKFFVSVEAE